jgi:WXG100 family type VII secretion target
VSLVKVTFEDLQATSQSLDSGATNINDQLATLKSQVDSLIGNGWQGAASDAFNELYAGWQRGATQVHESLLGISKMLADAAKTYQDTEAQLSSQLRG